MDPPSACPAPARPAAGGSDWLARCIALPHNARLARLHLWASIGWSRTWGGASTAAFEEAAAAVRALATTSRTPASDDLDPRFPILYSGSAGETALLGLGLRSPERFEAIAEAIADAPGLRPELDRLRSLPAQLPEAATARLQPELARILELLEPSP